MSVEFVDTNILVYANNEDSPFHIICKALVEKAISSQMRAAIAIQNLIELYAVITDKRKVEHPLSPLKAKEIIDFYKDQEAIQRITPTSQTFNTVTELIAKHKPKAQSIFDYLLVATMIDNGVYEIYTANSDHFKPFSPTIKTINPLKD